MQKTPKMLLILDGWGLNSNKEGNAIANANTPNFNRLIKEYPHTELKTSGLDVGLPRGQMGNSEVGHVNIGAGRIIYQELTRINKEIEEGEFFKNAAFLRAIANAKLHNSDLHLMGLFSVGGVHSHIEHLEALLKLCKDYGVNNVYVHTFLDGRDVPPKSGLEDILRLENYMKELGLGKIVMVSGRYYAMDRDKRWERVELAYNAMVHGVGEMATSASEAVKRSYEKEVTDEFVLPTVITEAGKPIATIKRHDSIIFFNFRPDRAREITRAFVDVKFNGFKRDYFELYYVCFTQYDVTIENVDIAFLPQSYDNMLGQYLSKLGLKQLRIAETEKYAHVTFFFNGGIEEANPGEDRVLIPSPKVATYDLKPEMSAIEVTDRVIEEIDKDIYDVIVLNLANPDMVGHSGVMEAAIKAVETVDTCVGRVVEKLLEKGGAAYITADHGNAEQLIDYETGQPFTAHTTNVVPIVIVGEGNLSLREDGRLCDITPTLLERMGLQIPSEMTGISLIKK